MPAFAMEVSSFLSVRSEPIPTPNRASSASPGVIAAARNMLVSGYKFLQGRSESPAIMDQQQPVSTPTAAGPPQSRFPAATCEPGHTLHQSTPPGMAAPVLRGRDSTASSNSLARRRTPQRFVIGEANPYVLNAYNPGIPLHVRIANLQNIMETVLQQAISADASMRAIAEEVQSAIFLEKVMFDEFMTDFHQIPGVQQKVYSENRNYQGMLDSYTSHFGNHVEGVSEMMDNQCEFNKGHAAACARLKHICAAVADAAKAVQDERLELAQAAQEYARQSVETMRLQFEQIDDRCAQHGRELHDQFKVIQGEVQTLRAQSIVYQQRFAQQEDAQQRLKLIGANKLARAAAIHTEATGHMKQQAETVQSNLQTALSESHNPVWMVSREISPFLKQKNGSMIRTWKPSRRTRLLQPRRKKWRRRSDSPL